MNADRIMRLGVAIKVYTDTRFTGKIDAETLGFLGKLEANLGDKGVAVMSSVARMMAIFDNWQDADPAMPKGMAEAYSIQREYIEMRANQEGGLLDPERLLGLVYERLAKSGRADMPHEASTLRTFFDAEGVLPVAIITPLVAATGIRMDAWLELTTATAKKSILLGWWLMTKDEPEGEEETPDGE